MLRQLARRGQFSVEEMVDFYGVEAPVREVFVRYLSERSASADYSTLADWPGKEPRRWLRLGLAQGARCDQC